MTKLILFTELLEIGNELLGARATSNNVYEARKKLDYIFEKFEEDADYPVCELAMALDDIAINTLKFPKELKDYFHGIETFQAENEIYLHDLPHFHIMEQAQLMVGFFTILENLLATSMTPCDTHQAHLHLDDLFKAFEEDAEAHEDMLKAELNAMSNLEQMPINVGTFFQDLTHQLGIPVLTEEMERVTHDAI